MINPHNESSEPENTGDDPELSHEQEDESRQPVATDVPLAQEASVSPAGDPDSEAVDDDSESSAEEPDVSGEPQEQTRQSDHPSMGEESAPAPSPLAESAPSSVDEATDPASKRLVEEAVPGAEAGEGPIAQPRVETVEGTVSGAADPLPVELATERNEVGQELGSVDADKGDPAPGLEPGQSMPPDHSERSAIETAAAASAGEAIAPIGSTTTSPNPLMREVLAHNAFPEALNESLQVLLSWTHRQAWFMSGLRRTVSAFDEHHSRSEKSKNHWPVELIGTLEKRQKGLELTAKILRRCVEKNARPPSHDEDAPDAIEIESIGNRKWEKIMSDLISTPDGPDATSLIKHLDGNRDAILSGLRKAAEQEQRRFFSLAEKGVLPVLDGLDDGKLNTASLVEKLQEEYADQRDELQEWFETYDKMRQGLLTLLKEVGIVLMKIELGNPVDYERHEPFDMEPHEGQDDETILSISRNGYEFRARSESLYQVIRPAQVIVVKN